jgi:ABC-type nitrate/sulfonate/bicarbonate transport system substrate-binding protein
MSTATLESQPKTRQKPVALTEAIYTICPVLVASHVAVHQGLLEAELKKVGGSLKYLWSLPGENWLSHFNHTLPNQFRDGGNIPAIHARAAGQRTKLIGLTFSNDGGQILTRVHSGINKVADLKGRKIGLYQRASTDRVDFWRATAERGILLALDLAGLKPDAVEIVDLKVSSPDYASSAPTKNSAERFATAATGANSHYGAELEALLSGKVDAIYANRGRAHLFQREGKVKAIEDLGRYPDWTLQVANSPYTITVSETLAEEHPEIVVAYLRAAIKAGRWIEANREEAADIFGSIISYWSGKCILRGELAKYHFVPNLSPRNLAGVEVEKQFLLERGYIRQDFEVERWADNRFLEEALSSL